MNSPFKLRSALYNKDDNSQPGVINSVVTGVDSTVSQVSQDISSEIPLNNNTGGTTTVVSESPNETAKRNASFSNKAEGKTAFDRDGRSVDKFDQRIAHAESKGKLGRAQRLQNRKSGFMESQANKLERAGGKLTNDQKIALNDASSKSGGTRVGRALRVFGGREAKTREVDPVAVTPASSNVNASVNLSTGNSSAKSISLGNDFMNNKPDFSRVIKSTNVPTGYEKYEAGIKDGSIPRNKDEGYDTAEMFLNKNS